MIIRREQFKAFQKIEDEKFIERVVKHLRDKHGNLLVKLPSNEFIVSDMPVETLRHLVRNGITQAREYGMTWETTLTSFVVMMFITSPNFHLYPAVNAILQDESVEPDNQTDKLVENITEAEWLEAKENYDPQAWKNEKV